MKYLFFLFFIIHNCLAFDNGQVITSADFNSKIVDLNNNLSNKGFTLRFNSVNPGDFINLSSINQNLTKLNELLLYSPPISEMNQTIINANTLTQKFEELSDNINPLYCGNRSDIYNQVFNRGSRNVYVFTSDYINPNSSLAIVVARGWPSVTGSGTIFVYDDQNALIWSTNYNLGTSSSSSRSETFIINPIFYRKGYRVAITHSSNNSSSSHSSYRPQVNLQYECP